MFTSGSSSWKRESSKSSRSTTYAGFELQCLEQGSKSGCSSGNFGLFGSPHFAQPLVAHQQLSHQRDRAGCCTCPLQSECDFWHRLSKCAGHCAKRTKRLLRVQHLGQSSVGRGEAGHRQFRQPLWDRQRRGAAADRVEVPMATLLGLWRRNTNRTSTSSGTQPNQSEVESSLCRSEHRQHQQCHDEQRCSPAVPDGLERSEGTPAGPADHG
mmetsp:Transcript_34715/g.55548  ORF Transcript_34715/g.55548 Transcript_34715/m.55548 type:complete len:212 (-) Transcript_34715:383-1018(-)